MKDNNGQLKPFVIDFECSNKLSETVWWRKVSYSQELFWL